MLGCNVVELNFESCEVGIHRQGHLGRHLGLVRLGGFRQGHLQLGELVKISKNPINNRGLDQ
jgi:hypothetical protein